MIEVRGELGGEAVQRLMKVLWLSCHTPTHVEHEMSWVYPSGRSSFYFGYDIVSEL